MELNGKRILIIKQSSLGDVVHALPLAHGLKRTSPSCEIGWVVESRLQDLIRHDRTIDQVFAVRIPSTSEPGAPKGVYWSALKSTLQTITSLREQFVRKPFDLVLDLHASFRSGILALTNPGGRRYGFADARELNTFFQHALVRNPLKKEHAVEKNLLFAQKLGFEVRSQDFFIDFGSEAEEEVELFLRGAGYCSTRPLIYMSPVARWASKFWLRQRWADLADRVLASGKQVVFGGGPGDLNYIQTIVRLMRMEPIIAAGKLSLAASIALLQRSDIYAGLDTGPMHIAAMVNTPVVALFGPTHPERVGPYGVASAVLQAPDVDCLSCRMRTCTHKSCMHGITVHAVYDAMERLYERAQRPQKCR
ncbi:MAG: ADP-heptose--LPS heptosyltransferase [Desulfobulbus propionicus]|nr:MAG: ADP-heptose--LPS heptosyltransferase [Desulfobulbus propionicus]